MHIATLHAFMVAKFGTVMLLFQFSFILYTLEMHLYMIDVQANITIFNPATISPNVIWTEHIPYTVPPALVQVTAAPTADGIAVSWRWNGSSSSVLTCIRNLRIIYQPVGDKNKIFDIAKSATRLTLRGQQCTMGCTIIIRSIGVNRILTDKECTTSGRTQIWPKHNLLLCTIY